MRKTLLIIEDEKMQRIVLKEKFEGEGFEVSLASDGAEGLKIALENHPDVILLDILLPKVTGIGVLTKLRQDSWGETANVVILSNLTDLSDFKEVLGNETKNLVKSDSKLSDVVSAVNDALA